MKHKNLFLVLTLALVALLSCSDENEFGNEMQPVGDRFSANKVDTISITTSTITTDTIKTSGVNQFMLGGLWHDYLGMSRAGFASQLWFGDLGYYADSVHRREHIEIDSAFILLPYYEMFGDSSSVIEIEIYELNQAISNYEDYYSNTNINDYYSESDLIGKISFSAYDLDNTYNTVYSGNDSTIIFGLQIPLPQEIVDRLLDNIDDYYTGTDDQSAVEIFQQNYFKGIYVKPTFGNQSFVQIDPFYDQTTYHARMQISYHDTTQNYWYTYIDDIDTTYDEVNTLQIDTVYDSIYVNIPHELRYFINNECGRFSVIENSFEGAKISSELNIPSKENIYIRGGGALRVKVDFPDLSVHPEFLPLPGEDSARIAINSATLTMHVNQDIIDISSETNLSNIFAYIDNDEYRFNVPDYDLSSSYFDGSYNLVDHTYTINLVEYVQNLITGTDAAKEYDLILCIEDDASSPMYTILQSENSTENPISLEIIYTRY